MVARYLSFRSLVMIVILGLQVAVPAGAPGATQADVARERDALRQRITARFEVVPLSGGIGLVPRSRTGSVRLIELSDGAVAINGVIVTGRELRDQLGADADLVVQLTYLDAAERRALFGLDRAAEPAAPPAPRATPETPAAPAPPQAPEPSRRIYRSGGFVRLFRGVTIAEHEQMRGDVVSVFGSVRVDGEVTGDVVAVMGSVRLGPQSRVGGEVTAVGGTIERALGSEVRGDMNEIGFGAPGFDPDFWRSRTYFPFGPFFPFARTTRLLGTLVRLSLLALVVAAIVLIAQGWVERIGERAASDPIRAGLVGFLTQLLFVPVLAITCVILAVSIIGIPLLLLVPFALVAALVVLLAGLTGVSLSVGRRVGERLGWSVASPYVLVLAGLVLILLPLLTARVLGVAGGFLDAFAVPLAVVGVMIEYAAWTVGLGAAILVRVDRRRARAAAPAEPPESPAFPSGPVAP